MKPLFQQIPKTPSLFLVRPRLVVYPKDLRIHKNLANTVAEKKSLMPEFRSHASAGTDMSGRTTQ